MPNSYPHDRIFNLHLTPIQDSYNPGRLEALFFLLAGKQYIPFMKLTIF